MLNVEIQLFSTSKLVGLFRINNHKQRRKINCSFLPITYLASPTKNTKIPRWGQSFPPCPHSAAPCSACSWVRHYDCMSARFCSRMSTVPMYLSSMHRRLLLIYLRLTAGLSVNNASRSAVQLRLPYWVVVVLRQWRPQKSIEIFPPLIVAVSASPAELRMHNTSRLVDKYSAFCLRRLHGAADAAAATLPSTVLPTTAPVRCNIISVSAATVYCTHCWSGCYPLRVIALSLRDQNVPFPAGVDLLAIETKVLLRQFLSVTNWLLYRSLRSRCVNVTDCVRLNTGM